MGVFSPELAAQLRSQGAAFWHLSLTCPANVHDLFTLLSRCATGHSCLPAHALVRLSCSWFSGQAQVHPDRSLQLFCNAGCCCRAAGRPGSIEWHLKAHSDTLQLVLAGAGRLQRAAAAGDPHPGQQPTHICRWAASPDVDLSFCMSVRCDVGRLGRLVVAPPLCSTLAKCVKVAHWSMMSSNVFSLQMSILIEPVCLLRAVRSQLQSQILLHSDNGPDPRLCISVRTCNERLSRF